MTDSKKSYYMGVLLMLISATGLSFIALFGKLGNAIFSLPSLIFWRFTVSLLFCFPFFLFRGTLRGFFAQRGYMMHLLRALCVLGAQYSFYYYLQRNSLLNATVLLSLGPLFIPMLERGILKKHVAKSTWIGVGISLIGAVLILQPDKEIFTFTSLVGLFSGFSQGASQVVLGIHSKKENVELGIFNLFLLCALLSLIPLLTLQAPLWLEKPQWSWAAILISLLAIASIANQVFRSLAYKHASPSKLAAFLYFSVILSGFWDWVVYDNPPNLFSIFGAILVILGGTLKIWIHYAKEKTNL